MQVHRQLERLAIASGSFHAIRLFIGGFHTIYLLSIGISLADVAKIQIVFSVCILIFEYPSGYLSDLWSRKGLVLLAAILLAAYLLILSSAPDLYALYFAEIIYALSLSAISGSFEGWTRNVAEGDEILYRVTAHRWIEYRSVFSVVSGIFGIFLAFYLASFELTYVIAAFFCTIPLFLFIRVPSKQKILNPSKSQIPQNSIGLITTLKTIVYNKKWWYYTLLIGLFSASIQVLYHFWQPIIVTDYAGLDLYQGTNALKLASMFGLTFVVQFLANRFVRRLEMNFDFTWKLSLFSALAACLVYAIGSALPNYAGSYVITSLALLLMFGFSSTLPPFFESYLVTMQDNETFSSAFSLSELFARFGSITALACAALVAETEDPAEVFIIPVIFFLMLTIALRYAPNTKHISS